MADEQRSQILAQTWVQAIIQAGGDIDKRYEIHAELASQAFDAFRTNRLSADEFQSRIMHLSSNQGTAITVEQLGQLIEYQEEDYRDGRYS